MRRTPNSPKLRRRLALAATAIAALAALAACGGGPAPSGGGVQAAPTSQVVPAVRDLLPDSVKQSGKLSFGALWETPPTIYVDEADPATPIGVTPQLAKQLGGVLGVDVTWQNLQWPAQLPGLQAGSVDVLFGQVSITAEREKSVVDLIPFQNRPYGLLLAAGNPHHVAKAADMCGLRVGVPIGSNTGQLMRNISEKSCVGGGKPAMTFNDYNGATAAVQALRGGSIDAWFDTAPSVAAIAASDQNAYAWTTVPTSEMPAEDTALAVAKDNPKLTAALVAAMKEIIRNGSYAKVYDAVPAGKDMMLTADAIVANPITHTPVGQKAGS